MNPFINNYKYIMDFERDIAIKIKSINIEGFFDDGEGIHLMRILNEIKEMKGRVVEIGSYMGLSTAFLSSVCKNNGENIICIDGFKGSQEHKDYLNDFSENSVDKLIDEVNLMEDGGLSDFAKSLNFHSNKREDIVKFLQEFKNSDKFDEYAKKTTGSTLEIFKANMEKMGTIENIDIIQKFSKDAVNDITEPIKFLFIDGDHSYEGVKLDFENYYPKVRSGGVIAFHDIGIFDSNEKSKLIGGYGWMGPSKFFYETIEKHKDLELLTDFGRFKPSSIRVLQKK